MDAAVAENKLAQMGVVAAKLPTGVIPLARHREQRTCSPSVADGIVPIVQAAVPRMEQLRSSRHVFFSKQQGVAQAIRDLGESDTLDGSECSVLRNRFAAGKPNSVIKTGRSNGHRIIAYRTR